MSFYLDELTRLHVGLISSFILFYNMLYIIKAEANFILVLKILHDNMNILPEFIGS